MAAPDEATIANGRSMDVPPVRPRSASQRGVPRAAATAARVKSAKPRKSMAEAR